MDLKKQKKWLYLGLVVFLVVIIFIAIGKKEEPAQKTAKFQLSSKTVADKILPSQKEGFVEDTETCYLITSDKIDTTETVSSNAVTSKTVLNSVEEVETTIETERALKTKAMNSGKETSDSAKRAVSVPTRKTTSTSKKAGRKTENKATVLVTTHVSSVPTIPQNTNTQNLTKDTIATTREPTQALTNDTTARKPTSTTTDKATQVNSTTSKPTESTKINTCTIEIECRSILENLDKLKAGKEAYVPANGIILKKMSIEFKEGETCFDILKRACKKRGIPLKYSYSNVYASYYVEGINKLFEFDCGAESGWTYKVNGRYPPKGASAYIVKNGDAILWRYSCSYK